MENAAIITGFTLAPSHRRRMSERASPPQRAYARIVPLPRGPYIIDGTATHRLRPRDIATWRKPAQKVCGLYAISPAAQDAIQGVFQKQAAATPFAQYCAWALIKHWRLWTNIPQYRDGDLDAAYEQFASNAGALLLRAVASEAGHPTEVEQDAIIAEEGLLMTALMTASEKLRLIAIQLNLDLVLEVERSCRGPLERIPFWNFGKVRKVTEAGRRALETQWIEVSEPEGMEPGGLRAMVTGRRGLLEDFVEYEVSVRGVEGPEQGEVENVLRSIEGRPRAKVVRRGENVPPVRRAPS